MILHDVRKRPCAVLPDGGRELLRAEVRLALENLGFSVLSPRPADLADDGHPHYLPRLAEKKPELFVSVNLQGLLPGAPHTRALLEAGIPTLVWFVDNPWHLLSAMRDPSWKRLGLAVTDRSFVEPLKRAGAQTVLHLPLAASPAHLERAGATPEGLGGVVFAGRSAFPGLESFFAGQDAPPEILAKALGLLSAGGRPDFAWWVRELGLPAAQENFWPGKKARKPGLGAALCNKAWRAACLRAAGQSPGGLTVFGDEGWRGESPGLDLRGPVDYYAHLPAIYRAAPFSLNLNSLLLPGGLSQRIFDAWAAGGFCLSDRSPGLEIFPAELSAAISFGAPEELPELAARLAGDPAGKEALRRDWRAHILAEHTYERRLSGALAELGIL